MLCATRWRKIVLVLIALIAGLQILHMALLNQLESKENAKRAHGNQHLLQLYSAMRDVIHASPQRLDPSGQYNIVHGVLGDGIQSKPSRTTLGATLVSQCSVNHLHHIAHLSKRWPGPVAVAVFVSEPELERRVGVAIELLLWLHQCVPSMRKNITIHLVTPFSSSPLRLPEQLQVQDAATCSNVAERVHQELSAGHNYAIGDGSVRYPGNLLRNVAMSTVSTSHVFVLDIDMLPNADLYEGFMAFLQQPEPPPDLTDPDSKCVYVIPAFEIQPNLALPQDKSQLLSLWEQNKVRPFYADICEKCQRPTDYNRWRGLQGSTEVKDGSSKVKVAYTLEWKDPWEPFFIAPRSVPLYDERFKQYGFNRISQVRRVLYLFNVGFNGFVTPLMWQIEKVCVWKKRMCCRVCEFINESLHSL